MALPPNRTASQTHALCFPPLLSTCPQNKLFQSTFIAVISPGASYYVRMQWTLLNSGVALCGCEWGAPGGVVPALVPAASPATEPQSSSACMLCAPGHTSTLTTLA